MTAIKFENNDEDAEIIFDIDIVSSGAILLFGWSATRFTWISFLRMPNCFNDVQNPEDAAWF